MLPYRLLAILVGCLCLAILVAEAVRQIKKPREVAVATLSPAEAASSRVREPVASRPRGSWFKDISDESGLDFVQAVGPVGTHFMPEINGSGGAMLDYDNDGDLDVFLVNLGKSPKASSDFGPEVNTSHRLYRQETGGHFTDQTLACGLSNTRRTGEIQLGIGCAVGDVNNDGFCDLYVTNYGPDQLFINDGGQHFIDVTQDANLGCQAWGTASAFFDYDRDGWLDLIVVNYCADKQFGHSIACGFVDGTVSYCGPHKFEPTVDRLYHNEGGKSLRNGVPQFSDVTTTSGLASMPTYGLGVAVCDFNGDAWPDFLIANDMRENRLWINQQDGSFREEASLRGVALSGDGVMQGCMGVAAADIDHDSDFDLVITNLVTEGSILYVNDGSGVFSDVSRAVDLANRSKQHTGWGVALVDLDLDGDLDMPMVNGFVVPSGSMFPPHGEDTFQQRTVKTDSPDVFFARYVDVNLLLLNNGGDKFIDASVDAGDFSRRDGSNRSLICGDVDNDGDIDLLTTSIAGRSRLFRNDMKHKGHWLKLDCRLAGTKRIAIGAVVCIRAGEKRWTSQVMPSSGFLASNDPAVHFGLGTVVHIDQMEVLWPDGSREQFPGTLVDQMLTIEQGSGISITHQ